MGPSRLLSGAKDVTERILPTAAQFVTDGGPETRYACVKNRDTWKNNQQFNLFFYQFCFCRYYGRKIFHIIYDHPEFDKLVSKHVPSNLQKNVRDTVENLRTKVGICVCHAIFLCYESERRYFLSQACRY